MGVYGADVSQLRDAAAKFDKAADRLDSISTQLAGDLSRAPWHGADAVLFRSQWDSDHSRRIVDGSTRLREAARSLRVNADDQEATSAAGTGALTGGGGGGPSVGSRPDGDAASSSGSGGDTDPLSVSGRGGLTKEFDNNWELAGADVHREGDYGLGAKGDAGFEFSFDGDEHKQFDGDQYGDKTEDAGTAHVSVGAQANGQVGAWAEDKVTLEGGVASAGVGYEAMVGARGDVGAGIQLDADGVQAGVTAGAFVGAEAKVSGEVEVGGLSGGMEAGVRAGVGAELSAQADVGLDNVKFEFEVGASLGVGFSVKPSIEFSPAELAGDIIKVFSF